MYFVHLPLSLPLPLLPFAFDVCSLFIFSTVGTYWISDLRRRHPLIRNIWLVYVFFSSSFACNISHCRPIKCNDANCTGFYFTAANVCNLFNKHCKPIELNVNKCEWVCVHTSCKQSAHILTQWIRHFQTFNFIIAKMNVTFPPCERPYYYLQCNN